MQANLIVIIKMLTHFLRRATDTTLSDSQHLLFDLNFGFEGSTDLSGTHISWDVSASLLYVKHRAQGLVVVTIPEAAITIPVTQLRHSVFSAENNNSRLRVDISFALKDGDIDLESFVSLPANHFHNSKYDFLLVLNAPRQVPFVLG